MFANVISEMLKIVQRSKEIQICAHMISQKLIIIRKYNDCCKCDITNVEICSMG